MQATDWECQRPQAQMVGKGVPMVARAAAPIRRKLCQVNAAQGESARREWRTSCRCCLEEAKGPPASVAVVGRVRRREAQAAAHEPNAEVTCVRPTLASKKETVTGVTSLGWILAASPMRRR